VKRCIAVLHKGQQHKEIYLSPIALAAAGVPGLHPWAWNQMCSCTWELQV